MLKLLRFFRNKELAKVTSFELPDHVTTKERNCTCFLESVTTRERINLKVIQVKSSCTSLSVTYQKNRSIRNGDLAGHIFPLPPLRQSEPELHVLDCEIQKQFLATEEIFRDHIKKVLSETCLSSFIQKRLVTYISMLEASKTRSHRRGFKIEVEIKVEVDKLVSIGSGCTGKEACPWREVCDRHVATRVTGEDCPICLTELSGAMCRMELRCSHVFHDSCVMKWLRNNTSCPMCRAKAIGETASIF